MHSVQNGATASWADRAKLKASADKVAADQLKSERNRAVNEFRATFHNSFVVYSPQRRHVHEIVDGGLIEFDEDADVVIERAQLDNVPTEALVGAVKAARRCAANLYRRRTMLAEIKQQVGSNKYIGMYKNEYGDGVVKSYFTSALGIPDDDLFVYCVDSLSASSVSIDEVQWVHSAVMRHRQQK